MGMSKHAAQPKDGSITRQCDGTPVDGTSDRDYPLQARCRTCNRLTTAETPQDAGWKHAAISTRESAVSAEASSENDEGKHQAERAAS